jgi:PAS domain S-box-containing protein
VRPGRDEAGLARAAEKALRESEERLRFALETSHTGAWDLNLVDHTAYRSLEHDRIFGYAELLPQWTYEMFLAHVLPDDRAMVDGKFRGAMETKSDWSFECRIRRPDGQVRRIWAAGRHRPDAAGDARLMAGIVQDITDRKAAEEALRESETRVRRKLDSVLSPEGDLGALDLGDILDAPAIQALMDHFYKLAHIPMSIIDCQGRLLVGVGWQDVCMRFHRAHPVACRNCVESDLQLSAGVPPGQARLYKCKNGMWDMATPIMVGDRHVGNIFTGQFFFDDEPLDTDLFRAQARQFGFQQDEYLAAVEAVPRLSRDQANTGMAFLTKLAEILSRLGYSNVKLARILVERDALLAVIQEREQQLRRAQEIAHLGSWELDLVNNHLSWSDEVYRIFGLQPQEFAATYEAFLERIHPDDRAAVDDAYAGAIREKRDCYEIEHRVIRKDTGEVRTVHEKCEHFRDAEGRIVRSVGMVHDISERKLSEAALAAAHRQIQSIIDNTPAIVYALDLEERFLLANATLAKVLHCTPEQMIGKRRHEFMPKEDADRHEANDRQVIEAGKALELEEYSQLPDRAIVWLTTKFPLRDTQNRIYAVAGISADITARKAAEAEIQRQMKALQAANEELARFNRVAVGRELRMTELKREINALLEKEGMAAKYKVVRE